MTRHKDLDGDWSRDPCEASDTPSTLDPSVLRSLVGDDPATLAELFSDFVNLNRLTVDELLSAVTEGNVGRVCSISHRLKSSSLSVGALHLGWLCRQFEEAARAGDSKIAAQRIEVFRCAFNEVELEISRLLDGLSQQAIERGAPGAAPAP